jgi:hypothetical protein
MPNPVQGLPLIGMQPPPGLAHHPMPPGFPARAGHDPMIPPGMRPPSVMMPPPGMSAPAGRGFSPVPLPPPGFAQTHGDQFSPSQGFPIQREVQPLGHPTHVRQGSASFDAAPGTPTQPIARPAPISRPAAMGQGRNGNDKDDGAEQHLGSRALLEDDEEPIAASPNLSGVRNQPPGPRPGPYSSSPFMDPGYVGIGHSPWAPTPSNNVFGPHGMPNSTWGVPSIPSAFGMTAPAPSIPGRLSQATPAAVRSMLVESYRDLARTSHMQADGHVHLHILKTVMENKLPGLGLSDQDISDLSETEGNQSNGGGSFEYRHSRGILTLRWVPDATEGHLPRSGAISSPIVGSAALGGN